MTRQPSSSHCVVLLLAFAWTGAARAGEPNEAALSKIAELNKRALLAYDSLEMETASALLHQALNLCKAAGLESNPAAARTHLHLGVVYIGGLKFAELGLAELRQAVSIDPTIRIEKSLANPEVLAAFEEARAPEGAHASNRPLPFPTGQERAGANGFGTAATGDRIGHPLVTRASQGQAIEIKAHVPPGMGASKVLLAYLAQDADDFLAREMVPVEHAAAWFHESIPATATRGAWVAYYIEVQDADEQTLARHGTPDEPHEITLIPENPSDELPLAGQGRPRPRQRGHGLWIVLAAGSGAGYHHGSPEMNPTDGDGNAIKESGFGGAQLLHIAPEIGYFQRENLVLSAQGRFQYVTGAQDVHVDNKTYHAAAAALAGFAKVTWLPGWTRKRLQPLLSLMLGAGQIRHNVTTPQNAHLTGCSTSGTCRDTVLGGLLLFGAGAGLRYRLGESLGFYVAANVIAGLPHVMINGDFNAGISVIR